MATVATTLGQILNPLTVYSIVSRIMHPSGILLREFGMQAGGANLVPIPTNRYTQDVFNNTRQVGQIRGNSQPAYSVSPQTVGQVEAKLPKLYEEINLDWDKIQGVRRMGDVVLDPMAVEYITRQMRYLSQRAINYRTGMLALMIRGRGYVANVNSDGEYLTPTQPGSGAFATLDWKHPTGNEGQLNMTGAGNIITGRWDNVGTDIPSNIVNINAAFASLGAGTLALAVCTSGIWLNILENTAVRNIAGSANTPFLEYKKLEGLNPDGTPINAFTARLRGLEWLRWLITDEVIEWGPPDNQTAVNLIDPTAVLFVVEPSRFYFLGLEGPTIVVEKIGQEERQVNGFHAWGMNSGWNPPKHSLFTVDRFWPHGNVPTAWAYGTVLF